MSRPSKFDIDKNKPIQTIRGERIDQKKLIQLLNRKFGSEYKVVVSASNQACFLIYIS